MSTCTLQFIIIISKTFPIKSLLANFFFFFTFSFYWSANISYLIKIVPSDFSIKFLYYKHFQIHRKDIIYLSIYIYIYWQHFFIDTYLIGHNRYFLSTYFFVNPFKLLYWSYDIRWELVDKPSIISYFLSSFCPTLGHHQGRMYYKNDVTFLCTLQLCKNERLFCCIM